MTVRWTAGSVLLLATILTARVAPAQTAVSVSARVGDFHVAVANYYHVPEREVIVVRERRISDDELPIVFFMAREARVSPSRIIALRESGRSWWAISVHLGLRPEVYYVPLAVTPGPPYGKAYGHYKKPRNKWNTIVLSDGDIMNLVHLRFLSEHYRIAPERVVEARGRHRDVVAVYADIHDTRERERKGGRNRDDGDDNDQGNGRGRGRKR